MEEPQFVRFLQTNDAPSEDAVREVTDFLVTPWQDLANIDAELQRLSELWDQAQSQRTQIVNFIDTYSIILSPIRRISPDILHEIFSYCLPTNRNPVMSTSEAPLILTQICRSWRSVALSCPRIWARIHIPICCDSDLNSEALNEEEFHAQNRLCYETMQRRCEHIQKWLSRSATFPISISIGYPNFGFGIIREDQTKWEDKIVKKLFETLLPFASRWKDIEIQLPSDLYLYLESLISAESVSSLQNLKLCARSRGRSLPGLDESSKLSLLHAPGLKSIAIRSWDLSAQLSPPLIWDGLTHFCAEMTFEAKSALHLLKQSPNLVYLQLSLVEQENDSQETSPSSVYLPFLRTLRIVDTENPAASAIFFDSLDTPRLQWLDYRKPGYYSYLPGDVGEISKPLIRFLDRSTDALTKVTFDARVVPASDLVHFLRTLKHLKHLVLGQEPKGSSRSIKFPPHQFGPRHFHLDLLIPDEDLESPDALNSEILLPSLEIFESIDVCGFSEDTLLRFIQARLQSFSAGRVSLLKCIRVKFNHVVDKANVDSEDFSLAIKECAEKARSPDVFLEIHHEQSRERGPLSPFYGVFCGSTWNHMDIPGQGELEM
jgi:hypothetical protein